MLRPDKCKWEAGGESGKRRGLRMQALFRLKYVIIIWPVIIALKRENIVYC